MTTLQIETPRVFLPLLAPARYKGAWGGRMGAKSHFYAGLLIECMVAKKTRAVCIREIQKSIAQSVKLLLEDKIKAFGISHMFRVLEDRIECPMNGGFITFQGMQNHTAESIKSLEGYDIAWVEEAQTISQRSLDLLIPTIIRKSSAELWFSWNPDSETDPVDQLLRGPKRKENAVVVRSLYSDNPYLPDDVVQEIMNDKQDEDRFAHIWLGEYKTYKDGAIYGKQMAQMLKENRLTIVPYSSGHEVNTIWDIGGDGTAIWFHQRVGREDRLIDHYEEIGTQLSDQAAMLKAKGYNYGAHVLPHDAGAESVRTGKTMEAQLNEMGVRGTVVLPRDDIDPGIELVKQLMSSLVIDAHKCAKGIDSLKNYQRKWDEERRVFSAKPLHNWASHSADALRYCAVWLSTLNTSTAKVREPGYSAMNMGGYY